MAERTLQMMRSTNVDDVRRAMRGQLREPGMSLVGSIAIGVGLFTLGAAIGAGATALYAPTSGRELRKRLGRNARDARQQAMDLGSSMRHRMDDARTSIEAELDHASTSPSKSARKGSKSNGATRSRTRKAASMSDGRAEA